MCKSRIGSNLLLTTTPKKKTELRRLAFKKAERNSIQKYLDENETLAGVDRLNGILKRDHAFGFRKLERLA
jgi:hypothetical protein